MVTNLLAYNKRKDIGKYNCGGFALRSRDWYVPRSWRKRAYDVEDMEDIDELFEDCVHDILRNFRELVQVEHYDGVPLNKDVIGFRFAIKYAGEQYKCGDEDCEDDDFGYDQEEDELDDFHFVLRRNGEWFHKPGAQLIDKLTSSPDENWPRYCGDYNGEIAWFTYR